LRLFTGYLALYVVGCCRLRCYCPLLIVALFVVGFDLFDVVVVTLLRCCYVYVDFTLLRVVFTFALLFVDCVVPTLLLICCLRCPTLRCCVVTLDFVVTLIVDLRCPIWCVVVDYVVVDLLRLRCWVAVCCTFTLRCVVVGALCRCCYVCCVAARCPLPLLICLRYVYVYYRCVVALPTFDLRCAVRCPRYHVDLVVAFPLLRLCRLRCYVAVYVDLPRWLRCVVGATLLRWVLRCVALRLPRCYVCPLPLRCVTLLLPLPLRLPRCCVYVRCCCCYVVVYTLPLRYVYAFPRCVALLPVTLLFPFALLPVTLLLLLLLLVTLPLRLICCCCCLRCCYVVVVVVVCCCCCCCLRCYRCPRLRLLLLICYVVTRFVCRCVVRCCYPVTLLLRLLIPLRCPLRLDYPVYVTFVVTVTVTRYPLPGCTVALVVALRLVGCVAVVAVTLRCRFTLLRLRVGCYVARLVIRWLAVTLRFALVTVHGYGCLHFTVAVGYVWLRLLRLRCLRLRLLLRLLPVCYGLRYVVVVGAVYVALRLLPLLRYVQRCCCPLPRYVTLPVVVTLLLLLLLFVVVI